MVVIFGNVGYYTVICNHRKMRKRNIKNLNNKKYINFLNNATMSKNSPLIFNFKRKSKKRPSPDPKVKKRRGPKKWLDKDLFFSVDPAKIKYFATGEIKTFKPVKKHRRNKTVKISYCGSNGKGLLKSSKIEFNKAIRA